MSTCMVFEPKLQVTTYVFWTVPVYVLGCAYLCTQVPIFCTPFRVFLSCSRVYCFTFEMSLKRSNVCFKPCRRFLDNCCSRWVTVESITSSSKFGMSRNSLCLLWKLILYLTHLSECMEVCHANLATESMMRPEHGQTEAVPAKRLREKMRRRDDETRLVWKNNELYGMLS